MSELSSLSDLELGLTSITLFLGVTKSALRFPIGSIGGNWNTMWLDKGECGGWFGKDTDLARESDLGTLSNLGRVVDLGYGVTGLGVNVGVSILLLFTRVDEERWSPTSRLGDPSEAAARVGYPKVSKKETSGLLLQEGEVHTLSVLLSHPSYVFSSKLLDRIGKLSLLVLSTSLLVKLQAQLVSYSSWSSDLMYGFWGQSWIGLG